MYRVGVWNGEKSRTLSIQKLRKMKLEATNKEPTQLGAEPPPYEGRQYTKLHQPMRQRHPTIYESYAFHEHHPYQLVCSQTLGIVDSL